jgi:uncharacterized protein
MGMVAADEGKREDFLPPTALESAVRALGADAVRYRADYIMLPMRDGVRLATVVIRPRAAGRYPTMMIRTPYQVTAFPEQFRAMHTAQFKNDYVMVVQNERGSEWSDGEFGFLTSTTADAQDTLDWLSAQDWSNGRVGLHGCSSTAENQLKLAAIGHPALRACVAMSSGAGIGDIPGAEGSKGCFYKGGIPMIRSAALWFAPFGTHLRPKLPANAEGDELSRIFRRYLVTVPSFRDPEYAGALRKSTREAPSGEVLRRMGAPRSGYETYLAEGPAGPAWRRVDLIDASHTGATPALNINGWMDIGAYETVKLFEFQQHHPEQYLIMAPTGHCRMLMTEPDARLGDRPVGDTGFPYDDIVTAWFDRFLRDEPGEWRPMPKVQVFLMGAATWLTGESWPLPDTVAQSLFLTSAEAANTIWGDGTLVPAAGDALADELIADPSNPVPSMGGGLGSDYPVCMDQRDVECRADVLVYSTPVLTVRTGPRTTSPRPVCGCAIATATTGQRNLSRMRSTASRSRASRRPTTSRPVTRSASRSPDPTSRSGTGTGIPASATTWPATARSPTSRCTMARATSRPCTFAPIRATSRSTRPWHPCGTVIAGRAMRPARRSGRCQR